MAVETSHADVIVVGGGLSGLLAAQKIQDQGKSVILLDKGRTVGGRMATRRMGSGQADHGAQFFTVRDATFQKMVDRWLDEKLIYLWSMGWSDGSLRPVTDDGHARYAANGGMNAIAKRLAEDIKQVRVNVQVTRALAGVSGWTIYDDSDRVYTSHALVLTAPVPQSLAVLDAGEARLSEADRATLEKIRYAPNLTGLFLLDRDVPLPAPGAIQRRSAPISWIANNRQKGISDAPVITVQADSEYSAQLWNDPDERILNALRTDLRVYLPDGVQFLEEQLKRWRYSRVIEPHPERYLKAQALPTLVFAGDAFGGPRVEGAVLSGIAAAEALKTL
jgi:renalase